LRTIASSGNEFERRGESRIGELGAASASRRGGFRRLPAPISAKTLRCLSVSRRLGYRRLRALLSRTTGRIAGKLQESLTACRNPNGPGYRSPGAKPHWTSLSRLPSGLRGVSPRYAGRNLPFRPGRQSETQQLRLVGPTWQDAIVPTWVIEGCEPSFARNLQASSVEEAYV